MNPIRLGLMLLPVGLLALGTACKPRKMLLYETFVPSHAKVARYSVKPVGSAQGAKDVQLSNYYIQVCDVSGKTSTNCQTTLVLENITNVRYGGAGVPGAGYAR